MGVNSSIEGSNPSFSVKMSAFEAQPLVVAAPAAVDAEDGCEACENGNGKEHPGHDEPPLGCRGVSTRRP